MSHPSQAQESASLPTLSDSSKAIGSPIRCQILAWLTREPMDVRTLCRVLRLGKQDVSYHLSILSKAGLVEFDGVGNRHVYHLAGTVRASIDGGIVRFRWHCRRGEGVAIQIPLANLDL